MDLSDSEIAEKGSEALQSGTEELESRLIDPGEHPVKRWVLLDGERWKVSFTILLLVAVALTTLGTIWPFEVRQLLTETNTVQTLFSTLLSGIILLVSIVVSINSIVLSEELGSIGNKRERVDESLTFRRDLEDLTGSGVSPAKPAAFLQIIIDTIQSKATQLSEIADQSEEEQFKEAVNEYVERIMADTEQATDTLEDATFGTFNVLKVGLNYNYSWQIYAARRLQSEYGDALSDEGREPFDELVDILEFFATGREFFKSLYFKRELSNLSGTLLYVSLPAILYTSYVLLALDANLIPDVTVFAISPLLVYVSVAYTIALAPFVVLTAYILRAATVAKRTLTSGPFILTQRSDEDLDDEAL
ncbi:hypothetical protein [Halorussus amylolyticus]|uniref:hypothetical protein n=1 Tax=Halorussus amylolyticus TaxID=1126242 RepID=UPI001043CEA9|nr:hypothetical protein [Halorussus amylolyticus]